MYSEILEGAGWKISENLETLKSEWCNGGKRIFDAPYLSPEDFSKIEKPRYPKIKEKYKLVFSEGNLLHEQE
jgi:hypothetical protein